MRNQQYETSDVGMEMAEEFIGSPSPVQSPTVHQTLVVLDYVITYLENLKSSNLQIDILKIENERLKRELTDVRAKIRNLEKKINEMEENTSTIQEDYETLMKIMNRARKLALFEEEERTVPLPLKWTETEI